jgi:hypothetical protein
MTFEPFIPLVMPSDVDAISIAKTGLRGIIDSYHGDWDFIIELVQNAADALDLKYNGNNQKKKNQRSRYLLTKNLERSALVIMASEWNPKKQKKYYSPIIRINHIFKKTTV